MKWLLLSITIATLAPSCKDPEYSAENTGPQKTGIEDAVISAEAIENVSVEDYWDEARSIRSEAEQIVLTSENSNCIEAKSFANASISLSEEAENTDDFRDAEKLIGKANDALIHAEDALTLCEEKIDIIYSVKINKKEGNR
jgi:hypothetical protein